MDPLRLLIVADDPLARAGLATLLDGRFECEIVEQVDSEIMEQDGVVDHTIDAVVWDVGWRRETAVFPDWLDGPWPVIALLPDTEEAEIIWDLILGETDHTGLINNPTGLQALLPRQLNADQLVATAQAVCQNLIVFDPRFMPDPLPKADLSDTVMADPLTPREAEVLQLLAEGLTNKGIAQRLDISNHTVKFHVTAIMTKLNAQSRTDAVVRATRQGLISL